MSSIIGYNRYIYPNNFQDGNFHHVVLSISGTYHTLYLDGIQVSQSVSPTNIFNLFSNIQNITIGCRSDKTQAFCGYISDFKIYNNAITSRQVTNLYLNRNLVIHYSFDNSINNVTANDALFIYDASFIGNATLTTNSTLGNYALYVTNTAFCAASSYLYSTPSINNNAITTNANTGLTISCWVNTFGFSNNDDVMCIFDIPFATSKKGISVDIYGNNQIYSTAFFYVSLPYDIYNVPSNEFTIFDNTYHHIVLSISETTHTLYLDAQQIAQNINAINIFQYYPAPISNIFIGSAADLSYGFNGAIDDFRIYNRELPISDIYQLYYNSHIPSIPVITSIIPTSNSITINFNAPSQYSSYVTGYQLDMCNNSISYSYSNQYIPSINSVIISELIPLTTYNTTLSSLYLYANTTQIANSFNSYYSTILDPPTNISIVSGSITYSSIQITLSDPSGNGNAINYVSNIGILIGTSNPYTITGLSSYTTYNNMITIQSSAYYTGTTTIGYSLPSSYIPSFTTLANL
jgi:hypothetical protein